MRYLILAGLLLLPVLLIRNAGGEETFGYTHFARMSNPAALPVYNRVQEWEPVILDQIAHWNANGVTLLQYVPQFDPSPEGPLCPPQGPDVVGAAVTICSQVGAVSIGYRSDLWNCFHPLDGSPCNIIGANCTAPDTVCHFEHSTIVVDPEWHPVAAFKIKAMCNGIAGALGVDNYAADDCTYYNSDSSIIYPGAITLAELAERDSGIHQPASVCETPPEFCLEPAPPSTPTPTATASPTATATVGPTPILPGRTPTPRETPCHPPQAKRCR